MPTFSTIFVTDNNGNRRTILQALHICRQYCRHCTYAVFVGIIIVIVVVSLSVSAARHPSSSTQVFAGDIVHISSLKRFLYDRAEIRQQPPEGAEQAEATIYVENCASKEQHNETNFSSRPLPYTAPQGLFNLQQQYLLAGSVLAINLTAHKPFHSDGSAKVCQFSNADDYEELLDADTKEEVIEAEKNGFCQTIEPPSGTSPHTTVVRFNIHSHGYYYYALAVVPGELTNVSYMYTLSKHYYDKKELTPYNCSVVDQNCVIDGLIIITPADCVLTLIPAPAAIEPSIPYTFYSEQSCAWGIVIVILCVTLLVYCVLIFIALCCVCYERKRTRHARGVV